MVVFNYFMEIWLIGAYHIVNTLFGQKIAHLNSRMHRCSIGHRLCRIQDMWNFTEVGHGNGEHDGAGTCIKRALAHEELK